MHAAEITRRLRDRYQFPEWALIAEVQNATGGRACNRFDALALRCWPGGAGLVRYGFEIKVSRSDFSRELADHDKRAALEQHCPMETDVRSQAPQNMLEVPGEGAAEGGDRQVAPPQEPR